MKTVVYSNQFVASIKVDNRILRESAGTVAVPFGSEYAIYLKNLSSVRAMVKVEIDGESVTDNTWLIVSANSSFDLERFIKNGNWNRGNRFKFIQRTGKIEQNRGIKGEDGLVRVEYKFEKLPDPEVHTHHYHHNHYDPYYPYYPYYPWRWYNSGYSAGGTINSSSIHTTGTQAFNSSAVFRSSSKGVTRGGIRGQSMESSNLVGSAGSDDSFSMSEANFQKCADAPSVNCFAAQVTPTASLDPGITVAGSESSQRFVDGGWFPTETASHIIVLKLMGAVGGKAVRRAITVKTKTKCVTCATVNWSGVKFCKECGTALEQI